MSNVSEVITHTGSENCNVNARDSHPGPASTVPLSGSVPNSCAKRTRKVKRGSLRAPGARAPGGTAAAARHRTCSLALSSLRKPPRPAGGPGRGHLTPAPGLGDPPPAERGLSGEVTGTAAPLPRQRPATSTETKPNPAHEGSQLRSLPGRRARLTANSGGLRPAGEAGDPRGGSARPPSARPGLRRSRHRPPPPLRPGQTGRRPTPLPPEPGRRRRRPAHLARTAATWRRPPGLSCGPASRPRISSCRPAATGRAGEAVAPRAGAEPPGRGEGRGGAGHHPAAADRGRRRRCLPPSPRQPRGPGAAAGWPLRGAVPPPVEAAGGRVQRPALDQVPGASCAGGGARGPASGAGRPQGRATGTGPWSPPAARAPLGSAGT